MNGRQFASIGGSYSTSFVGSWSLLSQNIAGNYSVIRLYATFKYGGGSSVGSSYSTFKLNGTTVKTGSYRYFAGDTQLGYTDITVYHNSDGTFPSQSVSINVNNYHMKNKSASGTISGVATIPRASSVHISSSSVTMGNALNVSINRASGNFYHTITYKFGGATGTIGTGIGTSKSWSVPTSLANQILNSTSGVGTIYCYTYNNGTHIGTSSVNFTATVPSNIVPSFDSLSIQRVDNTVPKDWGIYVKTKSSCVAKINGAKGSYGSTITSYSIAGGGYSCSSNTLTTGILNNAGTITFTAKVTDSRGRTETKTQSITVVDYSGPNIQSVLSQRCLKDGTINDDGTYAKCKATTSFSNCNNKNTLSEKVYFKKSGTENWSSETPFSNEVVIGNGSIDVDYSYDIKYEVSDTFTTVIFMDSISTAYSTVDYRKGGKGIAFGKVSEKNGFECAMDTEITGKLFVNGGASQFNPTYVPNGTDFNTLTTIGDYYKPSNVDCKDLVNAPITSTAFYLSVRKCDGIIIQHFLSFDNHESWYRSYYNWNKTWTNWCITANQQVIWSGNTSMGEGTTITLANDVSNYSLLTFYYDLGYGQSSTTMMSLLTDKISLSDSNWVGSPYNFLQNRSGYFVVSGNKVTSHDVHYINLPNGGSISSGVSTFQLYRVVGYRRGGIGY